jgi:hypothetical protein
MQRLLQRERVADVAASMQQLGVRYTGSDPCASIEIDLKPENRRHLEMLFSLDDQGKKAVPSVDDVDDQWGLRRLLQDGFRPAQLCHQQVLGRPSLTLRMSGTLPRDTAVGWLAGRLTEAGDRELSSFSGNEFFLSKDSIDATVREVDSSLHYGEPDLMLEMTNLANEFRFLQSTVLRQDESNVQAYIMPLVDNTRKLVLPLPIVYTTQTVRAGEELVAVGVREDEEAARQRLDKAPRERAKEAADHATELHLRAAQEQLVRSGYCQYTLAIFAERLFAAADRRFSRLVARGSRDAARALLIARRQAFDRYYHPSSSEQSDAASSSSSDQDGKELPRSFRLKLQAALEASLLQHPPPLSCEDLSRLISLKPEERYCQPLQPLQMQRTCEFSQLPAAVASQLDECLQDCMALPEVGAQNWSIEVCIKCCCCVPGSSNGSSRPSRPAARAVCSYLQKCQ